LFSLIDVESHRNLFRANSRGTRHVQPQSAQVLMYSDASPGKRMNWPPSLLTG
jgi:hypothetical protein